MENSISNSGNTKGKVNLITMILLSCGFNASASTFIGNDEYSSLAFSPVISYLILAGVFVLAILIFTFFKHKEEKQKRDRRSARQVHFARHSNHRLS